MITSGTEAEPGTIIAVSKKHFTVQTGKDALMITEVQPESRKRMGGYVGGEIASKTAVEAIAYYFQNYTHSSPMQLEKAIQYANS